MARGSLCMVSSLLLATACGSIGLDPEYSEGSGFQEDDEVDRLDQVTVDLTGRTYAAPVDALEVLQPVGLDALLHDYVEGALLFHVADEDLDRLDLVMTLGSADGSQDECTPVYDLPQADWSTNPELEIEGGSTEIDIANQPVALTSLSLSSVVSSDGSAWEDAHLWALLDTRDLLGGSVAEGTDVCELVENMGGECRACEDGAMACAVLELELQATAVDVPFDLDAGGC